VAMVRRRYAGQHVVGVTHGDVIAFLSLWAHGLPPEVRLKERFFPATASITTLTFHTDQREERPEYRYEVPHEIQ
jgi:broad specificity phosphatase PhoE